MSLGEQVEVDAAVETGEAVETPHPRACEQPWFTGELIGGPDLGQQLTHRRGVMLAFDDAVPHLACLRHRPRARRVAGIG
jgi:hypothetical protein